MKKALMLLVLVLALAACTKTVEKIPEFNESLVQPPEVQQEELVVRVAALESPSVVDVGEKFMIKWRVDSNKNLNIEHTAVHYGPVSVQDPKSPSDYRFSSKILSGTIPGEFAAETAVETYGRLYFRAHAIVEGRHYWSGEKSIIVNAPKPQETTPPVKQVVIEADDKGFYPGTAINLKKGEKAYIEFIVRNQSVYYGGLQVKSIYFDTGKVNKGEKATVDFTAYDSFTITSYWPASGVKKADLEVVVS